jgi:predicted  nucleic acid-binding Zn-ribbon protein
MNNWRDEQHWMHSMTSSQDKQISPADRFETTHGQLHHGGETVVEKRSEVVLISQDTFFTPRSIEPMFWRPRFMPASPTLAHTPFLFWLCGSVRPSETAVLGVGDGVAYFALCQAIDTLNLPGLCHGHGYWASAQGEPAPSPVPTAISAHADQLYDDRSVLKAWPADWGQIDKNSLDLLFVDLCNLPAGEEFRLESWLDLLTPDGVLVLHGTNDIQFQPDSRQLLADYTAEKPKIRFMSGNGLIALPLGRSVHRLQSLLDISPNGRVPRDIARMFRRLGEGVMAKAEHSTASRKTKEAEKALKTLQRTQEELKGNLEELQTAYLERHRTIANAQSRLFEANEQLKTSKLEIMRLEEQIEKSKTQASEHNADGNQSRLRHAEEALEEERRIRFSETAILTRKLEDMRHASEVMVKKLETRTKTAELQVTELQNSTSWRITKPIRILKSAFGRPRRKKKAR